MIQEAKKGKKLHSMKELAEFLGCSVQSAMTYKKNGKIPFHQIGKTVIFDTEDILSATKVETIK